MGIRGVHPRSIDHRITRWLPQRAGTGKVRAGRGVAEHWSYRSGTLLGQKGKVVWMIEAVIFDMDGLLVDSEPVWDLARRWMAREAGRTWTAEDHKAVMGVSTQEWVDYMIDRLELTLPPQAVEERIVGRMVEMYRAGIPYFAGAVDAVDMAAGHYRTALASGSHPTLIEAVTADAAIHGKFEVIVAADEVGSGKPAPDVYLAAAERLGVDARDCVCVEDSGNGILAAVRAGMKVIAVPDPRFPPDAAVLGQAHLVLGSLTDLSRERIDRLGEGQPLASGSRG
jgi:beta-phosphoglucomutase-like phosphatase (HAD superfamily)